MAIPMDSTLAVTCHGSKDIDSSLYEHWRKLSQALQVWGAEQERLLQQFSVATKEGDAFSFAFDGAKEFNPPAPYVSENVRSESELPVDIPRRKISTYSNDSDVVSSRTTLKSATVVTPKHRPLTMEFAMLDNVVKHKAFDRITCLVIILNSVLIALSAEYGMNQAEHSRFGETSDSIIDALELACALFFVVEVCLRVFVQRLRFFSGADWRWNFFDLALAVQAILEQFEKYVVKDLLGLSNLSFARMLRLLKTLKLLRMIRLMRSFRELRLILASLMGCAKSFLWAFLLLVSLTFMLSVCIMQACVEYSSSIGDSIDARQAIYKYFNSVPTSMLSLFMFITGGQDWELVGRPLRDTAPFAYALLIFFICIYYLLIVNIVNSVFLEAMMAHAQHDNQLTIMRQIEEREDYIEKLKMVYNELDDEGAGEITYENFCKRCEDPLLQAFIDSMEIHVVDAKHFFRTLSNGGKHPVDLEAFVEGCIKLKGHARSADLFDLVHQHRHFAREIRQWLGDMNDRLLFLVSENYAMKEKMASRQEQSKSCGERICVSSPAQIKATYSL